MANVEKMLSDVKGGDIVRIQLERSSYVGYRWGDGKDTVICEGGKRVLESEKEGFLKNYRDTILNPKEEDIFFCSLDEFGYTGEVINKIQLVGINLTHKTMCGEKVLGYEILRRSKHKEED